MISALTIRPWRELSQRKARTLLTVLTMAVAVSGVWIFVTPRELGAAMDERASLDQLHDVILRPDGVVMSPAELRELRKLPNVDGLEPRALFWTDIRVGDRVQKALLVGVDDTTDQHVNVVQLGSGSMPLQAEALNEPQNLRTGRLTLGIGDTGTALGSDGVWRPLRISGTGSTLYYANAAVDGDPVLYVPIETVWDIGGYAGYTRVEFSVQDRDDAATALAIDQVRAGLKAARPSVAYNALPELRPPGEWPGEDEFDNFSVLFWVIGAVSLISAALLIATTMNTLVREHRRTIGIMKALGGRQRQVVTNFALSALILGVAATALGIAIGIPLGNALVGLLAREYLGVDVGWRISSLGLLLSIAVGVGGSLLAATPALVRVARTPVQQAIGAPGLQGGFGRAGLDRALRHASALPRRWQLGIRSAARQKGRSAATILQVALAVGTMLAFTSATITMIWVSEQSRQAEGGDIEIRSSGTGPRLDNAAADLVRQVDGVQEVQPIVWADALVGDTDTFIWGLPAEPVYRYELDEGRWFTAAEDAANEAVAVVGPALADVHDLSVGSDVRLETARGSVLVEVVGIDTTMVGDGYALFAPLNTVLQARGMAQADQLWVTTRSAEHSEVDHVALAIRETLEANDYGFDVESRYIDIEAERASDRTVIAIIMALGVPVVAIGMIGLVSTMATNIMERRREIGVLRSIGASSRDIRGVFRSEASVLVVLGWALGLGVGWLLGRWILATINAAFHVSFPLMYPLWPMLAALAVTLGVAGLALWRPLARAGAVSASRALRYQ